MDSSFLVNSLGIGGALFVGLVLFWVLRGRFKRRISHDSGDWSIAPHKEVNWAEKRLQPRISISWEARIETLNESAAVQLKDISLGGAFAVCRNPLQINERLVITIDLPNDSPVKLNAEVVWTNANVPAEKIINRGMGIRFIDNSKEVREALERAIAAVFNPAETA